MSRIEEEEEEEDRPPEDRSPGPASPEDRTADLKTEFAARFGSPAEREFSIDKAIATPVGRLRGLLHGAETVASTVPVVTLPAGERDHLSGKRSPALSQLMTQFADALDKDREVARATGLSGALLRKAVALDDAVTYEIDVADMFIRGGDAGDLMAAVLLQRLLDRVLSAARAWLKGERGAPADPGGLRAAFGIAFKAAASRWQKPDGASASATSGDP